jgi:hypothetical protein
MTLFITHGQNLFKITRETSKTIFYKNVLPNKSFRVPTDIIYHDNYFGNCERLAYFDPDDLILGDIENKMLKTKFNPSSIISPDELRNTFFDGYKRVPITEELKLNHAFFHDDNFKLLNEAYDLRRHIYSLLCNTLQAYIRNYGDEYKQIFNRLLKKFTLFVESLDYCLYDKIHLMASTLNMPRLVEDLEKVLELEPY